MNSRSINTPAVLVEESFTKPAYLREHVARVHNGVRYLCIVCHKHFGRESYRNQHQKQCKGNRFTCNQCGKEFDKALQLQIHKSKIHPAHNKRRAQQSTSSTSANKRPRSELEDPLQSEDHMLPSGDDELTQAVREVYQQHWSAIRTHHHIGQ